MTDLVEFLEDLYMSLENDQHKKAYETLSKKISSRDVKEDTVKSLLINFFSFCLCIDLEEDAETLEELLVILREKIVRPQVPLFQEKIHEYMKHKDALYEHVTFAEGTHQKYCIVGDVQLGKTRTQIHLMIKSILCGVKCVFIVGNQLDQKTQAFDGIRYIEKEINRDFASFEGEVPIINLKCCGIDTVSDWLDPRSNCQILVLLANGSQLKKCIKSPYFKDAKFNLFIDEADKSVNSAETVGATCTLLPNLNIFIQEALNTVFTTATFLGLGFNPALDLAPDKVLRMKHHDQYINFNKLKIHYIDSYSKDVLPSTFSPPPPKKVGDDGEKVPPSKESVFNKDANLLPFIARFSKMMPYKNAINGQEDMIRICVIKTTIYQEHHTEILNKIISDTPTSFFTIVYDQKCKFHYHKLKKSRYVIGDGVSDGDIRGGGEGIGGAAFTKKDDYFTMSGHVHIKELISFAVNLKMGAPPRILIIAGNLADRGINFVCKDFKYHITDQYFRPSETSLSENVFQGLRILGCQSSDDTSVRNLYILAKDFIDTKQYLYTKELCLEKLNEGHLETEKMVYSIIKNTTVERNNLPARRIAKPVNPMKKVTRSTTCAYDQKAEFARLRTIMFPKWTMSTLKIARFMQELDPHKIYTEVEIKEYCLEKSIQLHFILQYKVGETNGFGTIIRKNPSSTYQLYPELVDSFVVIFNYTQGTQKK